MARGGAREGAGRKGLSSENSTVTIGTKIPKNIREEIEKLAEGEKISDKLRYIIEKGLEKVKEENKESQS